MNKERFQDNIQIFLDILGLTTDKIAEKIGMTKQSISNIRLKKTTLTTCVYVSLRVVMNIEAKNQNNNLYNMAIHYLIDNEENDIDKYNKYRDTLLVTSSGKNYPTAVSITQSIFSEISGKEVKATDYDFDDVPYWITNM